MKRVAHSLGPSHFSIAYIWTCASLHSLQFVLLIVIPGRTDSNHPPSAKEEAVLRALLKQNNDELLAINEKIDKARNAVTSARHAIEKLTESASMARTALEAYQGHKEGLSGSRDRLHAQLTLVQSTTLPSDPVPEACDHLCSFLAQDLEHRKTKVDVEMQEVEDTRTKLAALALAIQEDLRCQQYILHANEKTLGSYNAAQSGIQASLEDLKSALTVVKRIPEEIWLEILSIAILDETSRWKRGKEISVVLPALRFTHVCRTWRHVVQSAPKMWRALCYRLTTTKGPSAEIIQLWNKYRKQHPPLFTEDQLRMEHTFTRPALRDYMDSQQYLEYEIRQSHGESNAFGNLSVIACPTKLSIISTTGGKTQTIRWILLTGFSNLVDLSLCNVVPYRGFDLPSSLSALQIWFSIPNEPYGLARHLIPSLHTLRLQHCNVHSVPVLTQTKRLPNLHTLEISPLEHKIVERLDLPGLSTLILVSPAGKAVCPDQWLESIILVCANVTELQIVVNVRKGKGKEGPPSVFDALDVFAKLRAYVPKLQKLTFVGGDLDGSLLADILDGNNSKIQVPTQSLKGLTIEGCVGVSRWDCDRLIQLVGVLNVYRTVHGRTNIAPSNNVNL
ncbi:hypothetical protein M408DRAFT_27957 [Serendipita vermifera MAFF 305830]|uniref:Uncharacterized protein n=1 Tax=Serendipita vermifera MAFF 305830 TaxID=933852 RepID=A0A0C3ATQ5_SERVB|nr:hypothetical protein M408DRAFT_27957 [Serendipita vermifera MAFF 305830]